MNARPSIIKCLPTRYALVAVVRRRVGGVVAVNMPPSETATNEMRDSLE